jgi:hypothetical protein
VFLSVLLVKYKFWLENAGRYCTIHLIQRSTGVNYPNDFRLSNGMSVDEIARTLRVFND